MHIPQQEKKPICQKWFRDCGKDRTCGAPICAMIENTNTRSKDYSNLRKMPRPGHADYTAFIKYKGFQDYRGGGHFSGRLTAPLCFAGAVCMQILEQKGIIHWGTYPRYQTL